MVIQTVRLDQVDNVKPVKFACLCVCYFEVVPLGVPLGLSVVVEQQVVFVFIYFYSSVQIPTFEF